MIPKFLDFAIPSTFPNKGSSFVNQPYTVLKYSMRFKEFGWRYSTGIQGETTYHVILILAIGILACRETISTILFADILHLMIQRHHLFFFSLEFSYQNLPLPFHIIKLKHMSKPCKTELLHDKQTDT